MQQWAEQLREIALTHPKLLKQLLNLVPPVLWFFLLLRNIQANPRIQHLELWTKPNLPTDFLFLLSTLPPIVLIKYVFHCCQLSAHTKNRLFHPHKAILTAFCMLVSVQVFPLFSLLVPRIFVNTWKMPQYFIKIFRVPWKNFFNSLQQCPLAHTSIFLVLFPPQLLNPFPRLLKSTTSFFKYSVITNQPKLDLWMMIILSKAQNQFPKLKAFHSSYFLHPSIKHWTNPPSIC